ncbi:MAG: DUF4831 family protein [Bacteroidales bacterium]|nr:DUF4831 family protein [Bacteroidales bacterium]
MKNTFKVMLVALLMAVSTAAVAQAIPQNAGAKGGTAVYSLPVTSVTFTVEAVREDFIAGPYAEYAKKYMGSEARTSNGVSYYLKSIKMVPYLEADPAIRIAVNLKKAGAMEGFMQLCSQGLVVAADSYTGKEQTWRFPSLAGNDAFAGKDVENNLSTATTTLYKSVKTAHGYDKVAVSQSQVVEKSAEKKAAETAATIFRLRSMRMAIVTGDTDATYSGEAMDAAIKELMRMEDEYMSMFYGTTVESVQTMNFDVVPQAGRRDHKYVAFRLSDTEGLVPVSDLSGRPIVLDLELDDKVDAPAVSAKGDVIYYRVPRTATARVYDGAQLLLQTRIPMYQFGEMLSFPL